MKPLDHGHGRGADHTLAIEIQGRHDLRLGFSTEKKRDEAIEEINRFIGLSQEGVAPSPSTSPGPLPVYPSQSDESSTDRRARSPEQISESFTSLEDTTPRSSHHSDTVPLRSPTSILAPVSRVPETVLQQHVPHELKSLLPKAINVPEGILLSMPSKHFVCLTIGSRGDIQPYIALGRGLQKEGHKVTIVTHEEYKAWVTGFGIDHRTAGGDPGALMKLSVENKVFRHRLRPCSRTDASWARRCSHLSSSRRAYLTFVFSCINFLFLIFVVLVPYLARPTYAANVVTLFHLIRTISCSACRVLGAMQGRGRAFRESVCDGGRPHC